MTKYLQIAVIAIFLNICLSYVQKLFVTNSETSETIVAFLESAPTFAVVVFLFVDDYCGTVFRRSYFSWSVVESGILFLER